MKNSYLRQKQEQRFRQQLIAAIAQQKPARNRFVALLNSPFFIWLITLIFLTIGGAYLSRKQQCIADAENSIEKYQRLSVEMDARRRAIEQIVEQAKNIDDVRKGLANFANSYSDFRDRSLQDISYEFATIDQNIDESRDAELEKILSQKIDPITVTEFIEYDPIFFGQLGSLNGDLDKFANYNIQGLKDFVRKYFAGDRVRSLVERMSVLRSDCGWESVFKDILDGGRRVRLIEYPAVNVNFVRLLYTGKNSDSIVLDSAHVPALRPPFVKFKPDFDPIP